MSDLTLKIKEEDVKEVVDGLKAIENITTFRHSLSAGIGKLLIDVKKDIKAEIMSGLRYTKVDLLKWLGEENPTTIAEMTVDLRKAFVIAGAPTRNLDELKKWLKGE